MLRTVIEGKNTAAVNPLADWQECTYKLHSGVIIFLEQPIIQRNILHA